MDLIFVTLTSTMRTADLMAETVASQLLMTNIEIILYESGLNYELQVITIHKINTLHHS